MRSYQEQFEPKIAKNIEQLINRLETLNYPTGPSRYYGLELVMCLQAGALAGSMIVASALLEIYIRGLIVRYSENAQTGWSHPVEVERELEGMRKLGFAKLLDSLVNAGLFIPEDSQKAKTIYNDFRIPLHHGLPSRLLSRGRDHLPSILFDDSEFTGYKTTGMSDFEDYIEDTALTLIEDIVSILEKNAIT